MEWSTVITVITSAAVGAVASTVITVVDRYLERESRRDELALTKSLELAKERTALVKEVAEKGGGEAELYDNIALAEVYYRWLKHLMEKGTLPDKAERLKDLL